MSFNEFINRRRKELHMTVDELVRLSGLPKGTVSKLTAGVNRNPTLSTAEAICRALSCSLDDAVGLSASLKPTFSDEEFDLIRKYRALDRYGHSAIDAVLDIEYERCRPALRLITLPYYAAAASAGFGNPLELPSDEEIELEDTPEHRRGDFVVKVGGDSMLPDFSDGDKVLVRRQDTVEIGEIGIFVLNGESFIKKLGVNELISLNPHYPPKTYTSTDSIQCCGRVLCKL